MPKYACQHLHSHALTIIIGDGGWKKVVIYTSAVEESVAIGEIVPCELTLWVRSIYPTSLRSPTRRLPKDALLCAADMGVIARRTLPVESSDDMWHRIKMARVAIMLILLSQSFVDLWQFTTASGTFQKLLGFGISNDVNALLAAGIWAVTS